MFDKLEDLVKRLDEVMQELSEPDVVSDQNRFRNLMKEQNELAPIWVSSACRNGIKFVRNLAGAKSW